MDFHLAVNAILEGDAVGRIYVDDAPEPQVALAWTGHRFYLAGSHRNASFTAALRRSFSETVYPRQRQAGEGIFMLYYAPEGWESRIHEILEGTSPVQGLREFYALKTLRFDWRTLLPNGFALQFVDGSLLAQGHLENLELLIEELCSERASEQDFLQRSFGICLVWGDEIVGWCLSEYNSRDRCEVGIGTLEPYRQRGLATCLASAFVEQAFSRGVLQVGWHCWASNAASVATAVKVGFGRVKDYPVFLARY
jgi:GNAT superfamily N-acetyltransferase